MYFHPVVNSFTSVFVHATLSLSRLTRRLVLALSLYHATLRSRRESTSSDTGQKRCIKEQISFEITLC